jgi:acrylyl-CoA reductase (NADPH)
MNGATEVGIDSVMAPMARRRRAWERLATDLDPAKLAAMTTEIGLDDALPAAEALMAGKARGRTVVRIAG